MQGLFFRRSRSIDSSQRRSGVRAYHHGVGIGAFFGRVDRLIGRFNRWFAPAAIASGAVKDGRGPQADAQRVAAVLGELKKPPADEQDGD